MTMLYYSLIVTSATGGCKRLFFVFICKTIPSILVSLDNVRRRLEQKTQDLLHDDDDEEAALHERLPANVEPGFETSFKKIEPKMQQLKKR